MAMSIIIQRSKIATWLSRTVKCAVIRYAKLNLGTIPVQTVVHVFFKESMLSLEIHGTFYHWKGNEI